MIVDEAETQSITTADVEIPENINFDECCLFGDKTVHGCGPTAKREPCRLIKSMLYIFFYEIDHYGWPRKCVTFSYLTELDIRSYLKRNNIISKKTDDDIIMNEKNLIVNRLTRKSILVGDNMKICPKHRSSFGIDWFSRTTTCHHPEHASGHSAVMKDCRRVKLSTCLKIEDFPIGGR